MEVERLNLYRKENSLLTELPLLVFDKRPLVERLRGSGVW